MNWYKQGFIYKPSGKFNWAQSHAQIPTFYLSKNQEHRIYYTARNELGMSNISFIEVDPNNLQNISYTHDKHLLELGSAGTFDCHGIMMSSIVRNGDELFLYYTGWNKMVSTSYGLAMGLAISYDDGKTFKKYSDGPIIDRDIDTPIFAAMPNVILQDSVWKMWYIHCTEWKNISGNLEPVYLIKYAQSEDGVNWKKHEKPCINYDYDGESIGRPTVIKENDTYKMWYSTRGSVDYRSDKNNSYRIGYAESKNGLDWQRMDDKAGIQTSLEGWDSEMICYCHVVKINNKQFMFYNGNGFGRSGVGYAICD